MEIREEEVCSECGHLKESHDIGTGRCKVNFCECREFVCEKNQDVNCETSEVKDGMD